RVVDGVVEPEGQLDLVRMLRLAARLLEAREALVEVLERVVAAVGGGAAGGEGAGGGVGGAAGGAEGGAGGAPAVGGRHLRKSGFYRRGEVRPPASVDPAAAFS